LFHNDGKQDIEDNYAGRHTSKWLCRWDSLSRR